MCENYKDPELDEKDPCECEDPDCDCNEEGDTDPDPQGAPNFPPPGKRP